MAKMVLLVDDFDHKQRADETVRLAIDGQAYTLDLSAENAKLLREAVAPWLDVATSLGKHRIEVDSAKQPHKPPLNMRNERPAGGTWYQAAPDDSRETARTKAAYRKMVRRWAVSEGYEVPNRGSLPFALYAAFDEDRRERGLPVGPESVGL